MGYFPFAVQADTRKEIELRQIAPIEFGLLAAGQGSASIDARSGGRTTAGIAAALGGMYGQAEFEITGQPGEEVLVLLPQEAAMDHAGAGGSLALGRFLAEPSGILVLDGEGRAKVRVGATAQLGANAAPGHYQGMFTVDARYLR